MTRRKSEPPYIIGAAAMEKIMAVEGLYLDDQMKAMFEDFDRRGLSHKERRAIILKKYGGQKKKGDQP